jgi:hypothetical protein
MGKMDEDFEERRRPTIRLRQPGFAGWWNRTSAGKLFLISLALSFFVPLAILIGGLLLAYLWTTR